MPNQSGAPTNNQPGRPPGMIPNNNSGGVPQQPQTPGGGLARAISTGQIIRPSEGQPGPAVVAGRVLNQPSRMAPPTVASPSRAGKPLSSEDSENIGLPPPGKGFYSARAATMVSEIASADAVTTNNPTNLPAFNPHLESPSIRKTPGVDHKSSKPLTKDLKHVPGSSQSSAAPSVRPGMGRGSILNPQVDSARQIGAPGMRAMSPMQNRGSYKPPTIKRPLDAEGGVNRTPLANLPANGPVVAGDESGGDLKRQRTNV
jgi:DNA repair and recombination protein RAD52